MEKANKPTPLNVKVQEIELPKTDYSVYVGKKDIISNVEIFEGKHGKYVKVSGSQIGTIDNKDKSPIIATRLFGLQEDKNGVLGWGKETLLGQFLALKGAKTLEALKGKSIMIQVDIKDGKTFLTFV